MTISPANIFDASVEATINMAWTILKGQTISGVTTGLSGITIFTIGLGNAQVPPHADVLECIANDSRSTCYNPNYSAGTYYSSPTASDLQEIFVQVAGTVLRLSQ